MNRIVLQRGQHDTLADGGDVMEFAAWVAGEPHSDHPDCVSRVFGAFARPVNDWLDDAERQQLLPFAILAVGTNTGPDDDRTRMYLCADAAIRIFLPLALDALGLPNQAREFRAREAVRDRASALRARDAARAAADHYAADHYAAAHYAADAAHHAAYYAANTEGDTAHIDAAAAADAAATTALAAHYAANTEGDTAHVAAVRAEVIRESLALLQRLCEVGRAPAPAMIAERRAVVEASARGAGDTP
jgi:hypothetical protein